MSATFDPITLTEQLTGVTEDEINRQDQDDISRASWYSLLQENVQLKEILNTDSTRDQIIVFLAKSRQDLIRQLWLVYRIQHQLYRALQYTLNQLQSINQG